jgi:glycosyltransferase involved in cell wall biosynthesis
MKISIITPALNSAAFLGNVIENVASQGYPDVEHIVVDGGSVDGTVDVLKANNHIRWISERDRGQSDAINKGFCMCTGDVLAWQNADDLYAPGVFKTVAEYFIAHENVDIVYGDYQLIESDGNWICDVHPIEWNEWQFAHGRFVPLQPTLFWRRRVYEAVGELDLTLHYCMDVDFLARAIKKRARFARIPEILGMFRVHLGSKTQNKKNRKAVETEYRLVLGHHFNYGIFDTTLFLLFQQRKKIASLVKRKMLRRT